MRLIDIDKRFEEWQELLQATFPLLPCQMPHQFFLNAPTVDAEPVRHGKWTIYKECSECCELALYNANEEFVLSKYCPHCGAKMDLK